MASRVQRSPGFLSKVERGRAPASEETLKRIAAVLEVPIAAINREESS